MTHNNYKLRKVGLISIFQRKTLPFSHSSTFRVSLSIFFFFFFDEIKSLYLKENSKNAHV